MALNLKQAAERFGLSECTMRRFVISGRVPHRRLGRKIYFMPDDIEAILAASLVPASGTIRDIAVTV